MSGGLSGKQSTATSLSVSTLTSQAAASSTHLESGWILSKIMRCKAFTSSNDWSFEDSMGKLNCTVTAPHHQQFHQYFELFAGNNLEKDNFFPALTIIVVMEDIVRHLSFISDHKLLQVHGHDPSVSYPPRRSDHVFFHKVSKSPLIGWVGAAHTNDL